MEYSKCHCGLKGREFGRIVENDIFIPNIEFEYEEGLKALFLYQGKLLCFPCLCLLTSCCTTCLERTDTLFRDKNCKNTPYVCKPCLNKGQNHKWACYSDGCMTPEDIAQEEYEILMGEDDEEEHPFI